MYILQQSASVFDPESQKHDPHLTRCHPLCKHKNIWRKIIFLCWRFCFEQFASSNTPILLPLSNLSTKLPVQQLFLNSVFSQPFLPPPSNFHVCVFHMCVHVCLCVHLHTCVCCLIVVSVIVKHPGLPFVWKMGTIQIPFIIIINKTGLQCLCLKMSYTWLTCGKATFTTMENPANSLSFRSILTLQHRSGQNLVSEDPVIIRSNSHTFLDQS